MPINIETLRFEVQLNKLDNSQIVLSPLVVGELLDRLEEAEEAWKISDQTVYDLTEKVVPNIQEKLEAAEKERDDVVQQLVQSEIGKRKISEARDALQAEVGKLKEIEVARCVKINGYIVDNARLAEEVDRLKAKIEVMERQEAD